MHPGPASRVACRLGLLALLVAGVSACGARHEDPRAGATPPVSAGQCNDMPDLDGDPGIVRGSHWASDHQSWGDRITVYACTASRGPGWVRMRASSSSVTITPGRLPLERGSHGPGVYAFRVTVDQGEAGPLTVQTVDGDGEPMDSWSGPTIEPDGDGWHLTLTQGPAPTSGRAEPPPATARAVIPAPAEAGAHRRSARAEAAVEIRTFPVPPGSTEVGAPPEHARYLRHLTMFNLPVDMSLTRTRFFLVHRGVGPTVAWYVHHTTANRDTATYHHGGRVSPEALVWWQPHLAAQAFSPPTHVVSYTRLGRHLTAIRADVTLAARSDRTASTLVPDGVTSLEVTQDTLDGTDTPATTHTVKDRATLTRVIEAFDHVAGDYVTTESFGCGEPRAVEHRYSATFHWPGHTLEVGEGDPRCYVGRTLTLDGAPLPQKVANGDGLRGALARAFHGS